MVRNSGGQIRLVGGCVRDALIGRKNTDIDLASTLSPQTLIELFQKNQIKWVNIGIEHGTVGIILQEKLYEITTLRQDVRTFGRKAEVVFGTSWEEDANRRDFTINALSYCPLEDKMYDYVNGLDDLQKKLVRFIGNPEQRVQEDYLRILRFFRFLSYFEQKLELDQASFQACTKYKQSLAQISSERKWVELSKILSFQHNDWVIDLLVDSGVMEEILGCKIAREYHEVFSRIQAIGQSHHIILLKLLALTGTYFNSQALQHQLRFSTNDRKLLEEYRQLITIEKEPYNMVYHHGKEMVKNALIFCGAEQSLLQQIDEINIAKMPLQGNDIMQHFSLTQSTDIGKLLRQATRIWIDRRGKIDKLQLLKQLSGAAGKAS